jgi:predicted secreted protein
MWRALALLGLAATTAHAADGAQSRAIGFSPDGKFFAFEQYGVQDGSGFAYSDIFVIDIAANQWVSGTPVRIVDEAEEGNIDSARNKAMGQAKPIIDAMRATGSFDTLLHRPFTDFTNDRRRVRFARWYSSTADSGAYDALGSYEIAVKDVTLPVPQECTETDIAMPVGMEVTMKNLKTSTVKSMTKDSAIPKSRRCSHAYDIEAVFAPSSFNVPGDPLIALVGVYARGFEGSDRRFIAVPIELVE